MAFTRRALILLAGLAAGGCVPAPANVDLPNAASTHAPAVAPIAAERFAEPPLTLYYGDSLTEESRRYLGGHGREVKADTGTALCDWTDVIERDVVERQPDRVVVAFSGNASTPCMADVSWEQDEVLAEKYAGDLAALRSAVAPVPVLWARTPVKRDCCNGLQSLPFDIDAGAAVEKRDGSYARTLAGKQVRNRDGVHFCPSPKFFLTCPVPSPGARRFATELRAAPSPG